VLLLLDRCAVIIDELVELRKAKGFTQRELAKVANLTQPAIARLESKVTIPRLDTLLRVAMALDYNIELVQQSLPPQNTLEYLFEDYSGGSFETKLVDLGEPVGNEQW